jgi:hypothetical protein
MSYGVQNGDGRENRGLLESYGALKRIVQLNGSIILPF